MNKDLPKIGVIIPAYLETDAHIEYLKKSVESVTNQTYVGQIETIVVLNGRGRESVLDLTDTTTSLKDMGAKVLSFDKKLSAAVARNIGAGYLANTDCKYLCFLDADDIFLAEKIEKQVHCMEEKSIDFCFTQAFCIDPAGNRVGEYPQPQDAFSHEDIKKHLPHVNMLIHSSVMVKMSSFFEAGMYPPTNEFKIKILDLYKHWNNKGNIHEDYLLWFNSINNGFKFYKMNERLLEYRLFTSVER